MDTSKTYTSATPKISILLPTYSRGQSGLFKKAVDSILNQTFANFELIIIDDASTDGTHQQIQEFMKKDSRVHCLLHPENIGLPAVSEYEAFMKAKGQYIIFAFDDFIYEKTTFESLYEAIHDSNYHLCYGLCKLHIDEKNSDAFYILGNPNISYLNAVNFIANAGLIVKKQVFYHIGLYDPHILLTRLCDWDLWIRISKHYPIKKIDTVIGGEFGETTSDSLGKNYSVNLPLTREYITLDRNNALLPDNFDEYDIAGSVTILGDYANFYLQQALTFYTSKKWHQDFYQSILKEKPKRKILFCGKDLSNYYLYFSELSHSKDYLVKCIISANGIYDINELLRTDIIIFDDEQPHSDIISILKKINISTFYFMTSFTVITKAQKNIIKMMEGILTTSSSIKDLFLRNNIHTNVQIFLPFQEKPEQLEINLNNDLAICAMENNIAVLNQIISSQKQDRLDLTYENNRYAMIDLLSRRIFDQESPLHKKIINEIKSKIPFEIKHKIKKIIKNTVSYLTQKNS